jgi:hypothetical protein
VFDEHVPAGLKRPFKGSVMVVNATGPESILEKLRSDPYIQENIWNLKKTEFIPFKTHFRISESAVIVGGTNTSAK